MSVKRDPNLPRFSVSRTPNLDAYVVLDRDNGLAPAAGPYLTQAQAVYVAYWLCEDAASIPHAPDPMGDVREVLRRWRP